MLSLRTEENIVEVEIVRQVSGSRDEFNFETSPHLFPLFMDWEIYHPWEGGSEGNVILNEI